MKTILKLAVVAGFAALAACGSHNSANNQATELNSTDMNASVGDLNGLNATDLNATGNADLNAAGAGAGTGATNAGGNLTANNAAGNAY
jgi:hypothetical protein